MENARTPSGPAWEIVPLGATPDGSERCAEETRTYAAPRTVAPTVFDLLLEALEAWADQFDGPQDEDLYVSGTDLLEWYSDWRLRVRAALTSSVIDPIWGQAGAAPAAPGPSGQTEEGVS